MDKLTMLFIRACKSREPRQRLLSVYRRFYSRTVKHEERYLVEILARIVDTYCTMPVLDVLTEVAPQTFWGDDTRDHWERSLDVLTDRIRYSEKQKFPGCVPPAMFRNAP